MGCDYSARPKTAPEDTLQKYEAGSLLSTLNLSDIEYVAIKYAPGTVLTETQLQKICEKLKISEIASEMSDFYGSLRSEDVYDREGFFATAVMLGKGDREEKCNLLINLAVPQRQPTISRNQGELLLRFMSIAALVYAPALVPFSERSTPALKSYLSFLTRRREALACTLVRSFFAEEAAIPTETLTTALLRRPENLMSTHGLREVAKGQLDEIIIPVVSPQKITARKTKKLRFADAKKTETEETPSEPQSGRHIQSILKRNSIS